MMWLATLNHDVSVLDFSLELLLCCRVNRLGDLLDFGQYLKAFGNISKPFATINLTKSPTFLGNFCKGVKIYHFSSEIVLGNFYRHLAIFFWSHFSAVNLLIDISSRLLMILVTLTLEMLVS